MANNIVSEEQVAKAEASGNISSIPNVRPIVPGINNTPGIPLTPTGKDPFGSGVISGTNFGLQPDLVNTSVPSYIPSYRLMPTAPAGVALQNSTIHSVVQSVVNENIIEGNSSGTSISLETNSIPNTNQLVLNLQNGINSQLSNDIQGDVTVDVPNFKASGPSHSSGCVPDPGATAGITRFLCEDTSFRVPPGTGGAANYQTVQNNGTPEPTQPVLNFLAPLTAMNNLGNTSTDIGITAVSAISAFAYTTIAAAPVPNFPTVMATLSITTPSTPGNYRADIRYFMYLTFSVGITAVAFAVTSSIADSMGFDAFSGLQTSNTASPGGRTNGNSSSLSIGTWPSSITITFNLIGQGSTNGAEIELNPITLAAPSSTLQVAFLPSV